MVADTLANKSRSGCTAVRESIMRQQGHRHGRDYYLSDLPLDEALERFRALLDQSGIALTTAFETIPLIEARGRVTAAPVWAVASSPHYDAAAMDGIAVRAKETIGATESSPLRLSSPDQG